MSLSPGFVGSGLAIPQLEAQGCKNARPNLTSIGGLGIGVHSNPPVIYNSTGLRDCLP